MEDTFFELTDFRLAGFLLSHGCLFKGVVEVGRGEVAFQFGPGENAQQPEEILTLYPGSVEYKHDAACRAMHDFTKLANQKNRRR